MKMSAFIKVSCTQTYTGRWLTAHARIEFRALLKRGLRAQSLTRDQSQSFWR